MKTCSKPVHILWAWLLMLAGELKDMRCDAYCGLSLRDGDTLYQKVPPNGSLWLFVYYNTGDNREVTAHMDGNVYPGTIFDQGVKHMVHYVIKGSLLILGRHNFDITCSDSSSNLVDTLNVVIQNLYPVSGLTVDGLRESTVYGLVNTNVSIDAQVNSGSKLTAEWIIGSNNTDTNLISQTYANVETDLNYVSFWDRSVRMDITLIVSNEINAESKKFTLSTVYPINGISIDTTPIATEANIPVTLNILFADDLTEMGPLFGISDWGDSVLNKTDLNIIPGSFSSMSHEYTSQGNRNITVVILSEVDQKNFTIPIAVWDDLSNVNMTVSSHSGKPGDDFLITILNPATEGFQYILDCGDGNVLSNSREVLTLDFVPPDRALSCSYSNAGVYEMTFKVFNDAFQKQINNTIIIENPLTRDTFLIEASSTVIPVPDGVATFTVSLTDLATIISAVCSWDFDVENGASAPVNTNIPTDFPLQKNFTYPAPGTYNVSYHCQNNISNVIVNAIVTTRAWLMSDIRVVVNNPIVMNRNIPTTDTLINMTLLDIERPPTQLFAHFIYGDDSSSNNFTIEQWETYHRYPLRSVYFGRVSLSHPVKGDLLLDFKVRQGAFQTDLSPLGGVVEKQQFEFRVQVPGPFQGEMILYFGDRTSSTRIVDVTTETNFTFSHIYKTVDDFVASVSGSSKATGNIYSENLDFVHPIAVNGPVTDLKVTIFPVSVMYPPGTLSANVSLERDIHKIRNMQCLVDFNEKLDPELRSWTGTIKPRGSFIIDFSYQTLGSKIITVNCTNNYLDTYLVAYANTYNPCFSDDPIFDRQYGLLETPMVVMNSVELKLVTRTIIMCPMSLPEFRWWLYEYTVGGQYVGEHTDLVQPHADFIQFPRGSLTPGLYKLTLKISFGPEHDNIWLQESTFVQIVQAPLVAEIMGGTIRLTGDPQAIVDGYTMSYDPAFGFHDKTGIEFLWQCGTFTSSTIEELIARPVEITSNCDDISTEVQPGRRQLMVAEGVTAMGYFFSLRVKKHNTTSVAATAFLQYSPNSINIKLMCKVNCELKVAVTSRMTLSILCDTCSEGQMLDATYAWTLTLWNNETQLYDKVAGSSTYFLESGHDNGQAVTIEENRLQNCSRYRIQGRMVVPTGQEAAAGREFITNCPPWGGTCTVDPTKGDVMKQKFTLSCKDWQDDGYKDPTNLTMLTDDSESTAMETDTYVLYYKFMLRKNGIILPIAEGGESTMPRIELPLVANQEGDDYEIVVRIYDALQDYTEVSMPILLNSSSSSNGTEMLDTMTFWNGQTYYTEQASTLNKQLRGITTASALVSKFPVPDVRSSLEIAAEGENHACFVAIIGTSTVSFTEGNVVTEDWSSLWHDLTNPSPNPIKDQLSALSERFSKMVHDRKNETESLTGQGITALGEGMATILFNSEVPESDTVLSGADIAVRGAAALHKLFTTVPFPIGAKIDEAVFGMTSLVDKLVEASIPSYDLSVGANLVFNSSDTGQDDATFVVGRLKLAQAIADKRKIHTSRTSVPSLEKALETMLESLLSQQVLGQPSKRIQRGSVSLVTDKLTGRSLAGTTVSAASIDLNLEAKEMDDSESDHDIAMDIKTTVFNKNPYSWANDGSSYEITSPVVKLDIKDKKGPKKLRKVTIRLKRGQTTPVPGMDKYFSVDTRSGPHGWLYNRLTLRSGSSVVVTYFACPTGVTKANAYFRTGRPPTRDRYDYWTKGDVIQSRKRRCAAVPCSDESSPVASDRAQSGATETGSSTFKFFVPPGYLSPGIVFAGFELPEFGDNNNDTLEYGFLSFSDTCRVWNNVTDTWDDSTCTVSDSSNPQETICTCDDPPGMTFASSFFVAPTTIDFTTVFSKFDLTNASVYGTLIGLLIVWFLALLWARRKDQQDKERWLVGYLKDNLVDDNYFYLLTVHTGMRRGAGTTSNVKFIVTGSTGDTGVRLLSDGKRTLDTGSVMCYIMATTHRLGDLRHVRVWHDDSGPFDKSSWYLDRMVMEDLQTGVRYNFICGKWLALDKEDGMLDRIVPVTLKDEIMTFDKLFAEHTRMGITDSHLWFSCFMRPERSTFTRVQRISCCMALLLLTMITSALFYQPEDRETGESTNKIGMEVRIGVMRFSMTTLWTSTVSIVITTFPILIFVVLFRCYRPKWGPRAQAQNHRRKGFLQMTKSSKVLDERKGQGEEADQNMSDLLDNALQANPLPHFFVYLTWLLLLGTIGACVFFLVLYSMQWGATTSEEWLGSFFVSFIESIFVLDPIKVLLLACLLAYCAANPYFSTQHQHVDLARVYTEAENFGREEIDLTAIPPDPMPESVLEAARKRRKEEELAQNVFMELLLYIFFVFCVFAVSYGNRDQNTFLINDHLSNMLYSSSGHAPFPFQSITSRQDVLKYMKQTMQQTVFPWTDIVGNELNWTERFFASDFTSFRVGPVRVRQVRMPKREKQTKVTRMYPPLHVNSKTFPCYDLDHEETRNFCVGWEFRTCTDDELIHKLTIPAWTYQDGASAMPVWGIFALYPIGGYYVDFSINRDVVAKMIEELSSHQWVDLQTKAVFAELSLYNPNANLLTFVRMAVEFPEVGSNVVWKSFKTLRIYSYLGAKGAFILLCELVALVVVIVFSVKAIIKMKTQKRAYFKDVWQVLDLLTLAASYVALVFYVIKMLAVRNVMDTWRTDPKVYVDFYLPVLWDEIYGYILAGLVFVTSLRLLRVLGYNKRITMIATVLARSNRELFGFTIIFFVIITAYMASGFILFVSSMYEFRSILDSYLTLYLVLLGKNVLGGFIADAPLWAQAYFLSLTILVILILYTMFQAILCNTTSSVRADIHTVPPPYGLTNVLEKIYRSIIADWIPHWFVSKANQTVAPNDGAKVPTVGPVPDILSRTWPSHLQADRRTQPHRVLAILSEHLNKLHQEESKTVRRKKKAAFTNLNQQKGMGSRETMI